ncbi:UNVERIFIED_CONTAM: hypothetical protein K2H54_015787 [Gekko kuhli]
MADAPRDAHHPAELLDTTFDGMTKKLAFFVVRAQNFLMNWGHLFPDDERRMDYIASRLRDRAADWYVDLHNADGPELQTVDAFMWALRVQYEDPNASKQAHAYLRTFRQRNKLMHEYSKKFKRQVAKIQGCPDGVLAEQYRLGLHPDIWETILHSIHPVSLLAWMREVVDAESHLRTIRIDNAATLGKGAPVAPRLKTSSRQKEGVQDQRMKQGLCLKCGEAGHFAAVYPGQSATGTAKKGPEKM